MTEQDEQNLRAPLKIHLEGPAVRCHRLALQDLVLFAKQLQNAVDRVGSLLLGIAESTRPGRRPSELKSECALDIVSISAGSVSMLCDLPIEPQVNLPLFEEDLGERALSAFVRGISVLADRQAPLPEGYDKGVLMALRESGKLFDHGINRISFHLRTKKGRWESYYDPEVHADVVARIQEPVTNRRTIEGRLLMGDFKETGLRCRLHPPAGRPIQCIFDEPLKEAVLAMLTRYVRITGEAVIAEGGIRSLTIEDIEAVDTPAEEAEPEGITKSFFDSTIDLETLAADQGVSETANFEALLGNFWPEEETADDFIAAVREWRHEGEVRDRP